MLYEVITHLALDPVADLLLDLQDLHLALQQAQQTFETLTAFVATILPYYAQLQEAGTIAVSTTSYNFV